MSEIFLAKDKLTTTNYNAWSALTSKQLYTQLTTHWSYKPRFNVKDVNFNREKMIPWISEIRYDKKGPQAKIPGPIRVES